MKTVVYVFSLLIVCVSMSFGTTHTVTNSGMTFLPDNLTITLGDTVQFILAPIHNAVEVTQSTWQANGTTPNNGFSVPFGGGRTVLTGVGTYYYVCSIHGPFGMKGIITVSPSTSNTIVNSGFTFLPDSLAVLSGDTVHFALETMHTAREVSEITWLANDTVSNGGFDLPFGGGSVILTQVGTHYYVCVPHASIGMKGRIIVMLSSSSITVSSAVMEGWNMLSLPVSVQDAREQTLFPQANSPAFAYLDGYVLKDTVANGIGYWVKFPAAESLHVRGSRVDAETLTVRQGWNMIGSLSTSIPVGNVTSIPGGIVTSNFFGYNGSYTVATNIDPGNAYWLKVNQGGKLILSTTPAIEGSARITISPGVEAPPSPPGREMGDLSSGLPMSFSLEQSYPNPFNPSAEIRYALPEAAYVNLLVDNLLGEEVAVLAVGIQEAGYKSVSFDARKHASGVYFYKLEATSVSDPRKTFMQVRKMLLMK